MSNKVLVATIVGIFVYTQVAYAQMTSSSYQIRWDSINTGGSDTASSTTYLLHDSLEPAVAGRSTSTSYAVDQGYRGGISDRTIIFNVYAQDTSSAFTASSLSGTTVTSSTTGVSVGSTIALIQDVGVSQVAAVGKVASLTGSTVTVDSWKNAGTQPTIDGSGDYVYLMNGASLDFGSISDGSVETGIVALDVTVDNTSGYVIQVFEDGDLRSSSYTIDDVADGAVSVGSEEYGARSSDTSIATSTFDTADTSITSSYQDVATESVVSFDSRNFVTFKVGTTVATTVGAYAHTVTFIASGTF
jgi:hypothetical protein